MRTRVAIGTAKSNRPLLGTRTIPAAVRMLTRTPTPRATLPKDRKAKPVGLHLGRVKAKVTAALLHRVRILRQANGVHRQKAALPRARRPLARHRARTTRMSVKTVRFGHGQSRPPKEAQRTPTTARDDQPNPRPLPLRRHSLSRAAPAVTRTKETSSGAYPTKKAGCVPGASQGSTSLAARTVPCETHTWPTTAKKRVSMSSLTRRISQRSTRSLAKAQYQAQCLCPTRTCLCPQKTKTKTTLLSLMQAQRQHLQALRKRRETQSPSCPPCQRAIIRLSASGQMAHRYGYGLATR